MDLGETLALAVKVIADWRVVFVAVAFLLLAVALRFVGSVYRRRSSPRRGSSAFVPRKDPGARAGGPASRRPDGGGRDSEPGEGMIE
jgi:hypothetical protein